MSEFFSAEWQSSGEKLSFKSSQISSRILAKPELLSAGFFTLLQVRTQVAPALIIAGLKLLGGEALLSGDDRRDHADGTAHDHAWNGPTSTCGPSFMNPCPGVLLIIRQDLCRLVHQSIRAPQWGPQRGSSLHPFGQKLLQQL